MSKPPFIKLNFAAPNVDVDRRDDGSIILSSGYALGDVDHSIGVMLRRWAERAPDRLYLLAATLDDPSIFQPTFVVFAEAAQPWDPVDPAFLDQD